MRAFVLSLLALVAAAIALAEVLLRPPAGDRLELIVILVLPALVAAAFVPLLRRWVSSLPSVAGAALAMGALSLAVGAAVSSAAANAMFLSDHDHRLFLVVLVLSSGLSLLVGQQLSRPLAHDVRRLGQVAASVADGDLTAATGIVRRDEVGRTAAAVDVMIERLRCAEEERARIATARQNLLTGVGHDLRTPLAALRAATESIQDGVGADPEKYLAVIATQVQILDQLIDQLFAYARIESGSLELRPEAVSIAELCDDAGDSLRPVADRAGVVLQAVAADPAVAEVDPSAFSRVLRNVIDNGVRHSPPGGTVSVLTERHDDRIVVVVNDDGPGFPPDFREVAFEPFTRADPARTTSGSSGLGLAISRAIVTAHGGTLDIVDAPHGSLRLELPAASRTRRNGHDI